MRTRLLRIALYVICCILSDCLLAHEADSIAFRQALRQRNFAINAFKQGNSMAAQDSMIIAYETFMRLERWDYASLCLYERVIEYMNVGDFDNMQVLLQRLQTLTAYDLSADSICAPLVFFNYYSVASAYYAQIDSGELAIHYGELSIAAMEQLPNPNQWLIIPPWNYFNQALYYDFYSEPKQIDSIEFYLQRAEQAAELLSDRIARQEVFISVQDLRAWLFYYDQQYSKAEQTMLQVIATIDTVAQENPNVIISERGEAYLFMVTLCREQGRFKEALTWQEKLTENNALRYNIDKTHSLQEIETRYEVEKQQIEMDQLKDRQIAFRRLIYLLASLLVSVVLLLIVLLLRKKNTEAQLYEAALEADDMRNAWTTAAENSNTSAIQLLAENLIKQMEESPVNPSCKAEIISRFRNLNIPSLSGFFAQATRLTTMDKRYILCLAAGMSVEQIAELFHIEPASVYTVRYRLRKKFPADCEFPY